MLLVVLDSSSLPSFITIILSQYFLMRLISCEINIIDMSKLLFKVINISKICFCNVTSNAVVGSSAIITLGFLIIDIAIMKRCLCPPDNMCG